MHYLARFIDWRRWRSLSLNCHTKQNKIFRYKTGIQLQGLGVWNPLEICKVKEGPNRMCKSRVFMNYKNYKHLTGDYLVIFRKS